MKIKEVNKYSSAGIKKLVAGLLKEQMEFIGEKRSLKTVYDTLNNSFKSGSTSRTVLIFSGKDAVGVCFFNVCKGIQSGGDYIWINEIFIKEEYRKQGYGKQLLNHVIGIGKKLNCKSVFAQRDIKNINSKSLFSKSGFNQDKVIWMSKKLN